jgi:hypothetical protein
MNPIPPVTSWLMNPYVLSSFGAVIALAFVIFALVYFVFFKLKVGLPGGAASGGSGLALVCTEHSGILARVIALEEWRKQHDIDYRDVLRELRRRKT